MVESLLQMLALLLLGFTLGLRHAFDPDHVVAISTMANHTRSVKKSSFLGAIWGVGHTLVLFIAGFLILSLKLSIPDKIASSFELLVGIVLIILGVDSLRKIASDRIHMHEHTHGDRQHSHFHSHTEFTSHSHLHAHRFFAVGMMHGLAGSAALMLLILATISSIIQGLMFILTFGLGLIVSMAVISAMVSLPVVVSSRFAKINSVIKIIAGLASISLGSFMIYEIGFVNGILL